MQEKSEKVINNFNLHFVNKNMYKKFADQEKSVTFAKELETN